MKNPKIYKILFIKQKKTTINKINKLKKEFEYLNNEYS